MAALVLGELSRARGAAHADVLDAPAEAHRDVALDVRQHDRARGLVKGRSDTDFLEAPAARDRHGDLVRAMKSVGDDHRRAQRFVGESVLRRLQKVVHRLAAVAAVERVRVGQERLAAGALDPFGDGAQICGLT